MNNVRLGVAVVLFALLMGELPEAHARIKLITLPVRERVEIQLDSPGAALIEEERVVPLVQGFNQVDFSWANTRIDPDTIVFRVLESSEPVKVVSVSYPPNENALVWSVHARQGGPARIRISYLLGNLERNFRYRAVASPDESTLTLFQYLGVKNLANEEFGTSELWAGFGERIRKSIGLNETKEILIGKYPGVPVKKTYTCNAAKLGYLEPAKRKLRVPMNYVLKNDSVNRLGIAALPRGKVRIFQQDGKGSTAFIGEDWGKFTPLDDELALYLGLARDISVIRTIERHQRHRVAGNLYDHEIVVKYEIENFKDEPVTLDVVEDLKFLRNEVRGDTGRAVEWELGEATDFDLGPIAEKSSAGEVMFQTRLPPRTTDGKARKVVRKFHVFIKHEW